MINKSTFRSSLIHDRIQDKILFDNYYVMQKTFGKSKYTKYILQYTHVSILIIQIFLLLYKIVIIDFHFKVCYKLDLDLKRTLL